MSETPSSDSPDLPLRTRVANRRRSPGLSFRASSKVICRKGIMGLGPNIALAVADVSEIGVQLLVKETLQRGQEVEVCLLAPGHSRELKRAGRVVWASAASACS